MDSIGHRTILNGQATNSALPFTGLTSCVLYGVLYFHVLKGFRSPSLASSSVKVGSRRQLHGFVQTAFSRPSALIPQMLARARRTLAASVAQKVQVRPKAQIRSVHAYTSFGKRTVTLIPGDGIGPEIASSVVGIIQASGAAVDFERFDLSPQEPFPQELLMRSVLFLNMEFGITFSCQTQPACLFRY
jgi:hypothetical protein